jgi:hypothetical protein
MLCHLHYWLGPALHKISPLDFLSVDFGRTLFLNSYDTELPGAEVCSLKNIDHKESYTPQLMLTILDEVLASHVCFYTFSLIGCGKPYNAHYHSS